MVEEKKLTGWLVLIYVCLSAWAITTIFPFVWVIINSFKPRGQIRSDSFSLPIGETFTLENYLKTFKNFSIPVAYRNSLVISITVTVVVVIFAGIAAYAFARYKFRFQSVCYSLVIASMMFPVFSTIIPVFRMEFTWGIANTKNVWLSLLSVILPQIAGNLSFAIVVLMGFIRSLPIDLEESAYLDGCSVYKIFYKIIMPVARPAFATVAIFTFLWSYNDMFTQIFFLRYPEQRSITLLLNDINSKAGTDYGMMCASVVLIVVPVLIVYILLQKNIIKGMTTGAVKG